MTSPPKATAGPVSAAAVRARFHAQVRGRTNRSIRPPEHFVRRRPRPAARYDLLRVSEDYVRKILDARVYDVAEQTPLDEMTRLGGRLGRAVLLKREDLQPVFSFKIRGAYNRIARLTDAERRAGVICASAGNHAQGVALSAQRLGIAATIVMPVT